MIQPPSKKREFQQELITRLSPLLPDAAIAAQSDFDAILTWLDAVAKNSNHTYRAYSKEAKRFIAWLVLTNKKLSSVKKDDLDTYFSVLSTPPESWVKRSSSHSEPTETAPRLLKPGGLSASSLAYSRRVLINLYTYLQNAGYLSNNPAILTKKFKIPQETTQDKYLDLNTWRFSWEQICDYEVTCCFSSVTHKEQMKAVRYRWVMALLYHTGIRAEEAVLASMANVQCNNDVWTLKVKGKGGKIRHITLNSALMQELVRYRRSLGMITDYPAPDEVLPLIRSLQANRPGNVTTRALSGLIREIAEFLIARSQDANITERLKLATTHWLRHTNATHRLMAGASLHSTSDELGHANLETTRIYAKTPSKDRKLDAERLVTLNVKPENSDNGPVY